MRPLTLVFDTQPIHIIDNKYTFDTWFLNILEKLSQASMIPRAHIKIL